MKSLFQLVLFFIAVNHIHADYYDRSCATNTTNLWLDIVIVVDNSKNMTNDGLELVFANIVDVFGENIRIGTNYVDPRSTRVALVTYSQNAVVAADLNQFQSFHDLYTTAEPVLASVAKTDQSFLAQGLLTAEQVLIAGRANNVRTNFQQMIIVYAAAYQGTGQLDPAPVANRLKNKGISISVVDMLPTTSDENYDVYNKLYPIATNSMFIRYDTNSATYLLQYAAKANCYCKSSWNQYQQSSYYPYGVCVQVSNSTTNWMAAKLACQNTIANGYLVTDFSSDKHTFIQALFHTATGLDAGYHNGLNFVNGLWYWQQAYGQRLVSLTDSNQPSDIIWNSGYPKAATTNTGVATISDSDGTGWENVNPYNNNQYYICEVNACDTDNYCP